MEPATQLWLFGACTTGIVTSFGFAWRCHSSVSARIARANDELYAYKLHVAEHFASITYAAAIERRTVDALEEIKSSLRRQEDKIDRFILGDRR